MTDPQQMAELFPGSDVAHGRSELLQTISAKGKHETRSWTEKRPASVEDWEKHLAGTAGLGIMPLNSKNQVRWGAIDVDVYQGLSIQKLNQQIQDAKLPLVICRSKSGGPHIFLFLKDHVPAQEMIEKLDSMAGFLGFGTSEIFPKQAMVAHSEKNPDFGSWINMPYFGGTQFLRYGLDHTGTALTSVAAFVSYAQSRRLSADEFRALTPPIPADIFPDGPPCLNRIFADRPSENRNILLSNAAVYAKRAIGEGWEATLDTYNAKFAQPLPQTEVEAIKRSYARKDYRYQCQVQPLCTFCDSSQCRKTKFGVGNGTLMPALRSLSKVNTIPPIWYLDMNLPNGTQARISLSSEELQNPRLFQRRCMETIHQMPPITKESEWHPFVQQMMEHLSVIEIPPEAGPVGQLKELVLEFLHNRAAQETWECLVRGIPFKEDGYYHFRVRDLTNFLAQQRFTLLKPNEIQAALKSELGAVGNSRKVGGRFVRFLTVKLTEPGNEALQVPEFETAY